MKHTGEQAFETVIEAHLLVNGYVSVAGDGFDRERAIFPETVLAFVRKTQPKEWAKLEALHGDRTGEQRDSARRTPRVALAAGAADRTAATGSGGLGPTGPVGSSDPADRSTVRRAPPSPTASRAGSPSVEDLVARLNERLGGDWSFDVQRHHRNGGGIEVTGEMKSNGARVQRIGTLPECVAQGDQRPCSFGLCANRFNRRRTALGISVTLCPIRRPSR